jgi:hypothetical protein
MAHYRSCRPQRLPAARSEAAGTPLASPSSITTLALERRGASCAS